MQIFFFMMYLTTVGTRRIDDPRDLWHAGWWPVKVVLWFLFTVIPFFLPSVIIQLYGEFSPEQQMKYVSDNKIFDF